MRPVAWRSRGARMVTVLGLCVWPWLAATAQEPAADAAIAALERKTQEAIQIAEKSVVSIARIHKDDHAAGFQTPNLGRLAGSSRLEEAFPTDADYVPVDFGAGVVIDASGLILTAYHVLGNAAESEYVVWSQHRPFKATLVAAEGWIDLAVLQVEADGLVPLEFAKTPPPEKGAFVLALGNPQAIARDGEPSAAWAMVSNTHRRALPAPERPNVGAGRDTLHHYGTLLQIDRRLPAGYNGGPLIDLHGKMVGLMTAYAGHPGTPAAAGFAIPVDEPFRRAVKELRTGKLPEFGFLGIGLQPLDVRLRRQEKHGAAVESVMAGTPAARSDLKVGDIVTHLQDQAIYDDDDLIREVSRLAPGDEVPLTIARSAGSPERSEVLQVTVTVTKRNAQNVRPAVATVPPPAWRGLRVDDATAAPREALLSVHLPPTGGLYISQVEPESAAWNGGLRPGMFVTEVAGQPLTTAREFWQQVPQIEGDVPLKILAANGETRLHTVSP